MYLFNDKWNENPLIPVGLILLLGWFFLRVIDMGIQNQDFRMALNLMSISGILYGLLLTVLGVMEYRTWKMENKRGRENTSTF